MGDGKFSFNGTFVRTEESAEEPHGTKGVKSRSFPVEQFDPEGEKNEQRSIQKG